jgi:hypothetical protein
MASKKIITFECDVRGHFRNQSECAKLVAGELVSLKAEPDNEYDANAIRVLNSSGKDLGYIPSEENEELLELLGAEQKVYCARVSKIELDDQDQILPWITIHLATDKDDLPFSQESRFTTSAKTISGGNKETVKSSDSEGESEDDSKNLLYGLLFIVSLFLIAGLISKI